VLTNVAHACVNAMNEIVQSTAQISRTTLIGVWDQQATSTTVQQPSLLAWRLKSDSLDFACVYFSLVERASKLGGDE